MARSTVKQMLSRVGNGAERLTRSLPGHQAAGYACLIWLSAILFKGGTWLTPWGTIFLLLVICVLLWSNRKLHRRLVSADAEAKGAVAAWREAQAMCDTVTAHSIVSVADARGRIISVNDAFCAISGYSREELLGQDHRILNSRHHSKAFWANVWRTLGRNEPWRGDICNRAKDGSLYWVDSTIAPMRDAAGRIQKYVSVRRDITSRVKAQAELARRGQELIKAREAADHANRAKGEFLANISHEIRTPMAAILGHADLMLDPNLTTESYQHGLQSIRRNGEHLLNLINEILDLSKIEAGKMKVERIATHLPRIAFEALSTVRPRALVKNLAVSLEFTTPIPQTGMTDPLRLRQILVNLLGNAIKFTETGAVTLRVSCDGPSETNTVVRFEVIDTGIGLTEEEISQLFQAFSQADTSTTRRFGGTGLGLTISQQLAKLLGGDIHVQSAAGKGSTFTLEVGMGPIRAGDMVDVSSESCSTEGNEGIAHISPDALRGVRILLAEDGRDNREIILAYLRCAGAEVEAVDTGRGAIDAILNARATGQNFSLVLMDMQMPILDGYGATSELRRMGYQGPIVALTANAMSDDKAKCINSGCTAYLSKPVQRNALIAMIARHIKLPTPQKKAA